VADALIGPWLVAKAKAQIAEQTGHSLSQTVISSEQQGEVSQRPRPQRFTPGPLPRAVRTTSNVAPNYLRSELRWSVAVAVLPFRI